MVNSIEEQGSTMIDKDIRQESRRFTSGEKLKKMLGLSKNYVAFTRILGAQYRIIIVYYNSRYPDYAISEAQVMNARIPVNLFHLGYSLRHITVRRIEEFEESLEDLYVFTVDLAGMYGDKSKEVSTIHPWRESVFTSYYIPTGSIRLDEAMTAKDFMSKDIMSSLTRSYYDDRQSMIGGANKNSRLISTVYNRDKDWVTFVFKTRATPDLSDKKTTGGPTGIEPSSTLSDNPQKVYFQMIRVKEFLALLKDTRPESLSSKKISWDDIREVIMTADIQVWCGCPSFYFQGIDYWLSQFDGAIYPCDIHPRRWNSPYLHGEGNSYVCKHLASLWNSIGFFATQMTSSIESVFKKEGIL